MPARQALLVDIEDTPLANDGNAEDDGVGARWEP